MKKWGDRLKKVEQLAQSFHLNPLASPYKPRLWPCQPSSVWKLFPRQSMAIGFAQSCREVTRDPTGCWTISSVCVFLDLTFVAFAFPRLCMFLHLKKKRQAWVKGSTWLRVTVSCGITTGKYQLFIAKRVWYSMMMCSDGDLSLDFFQDLHTVLDALLWGDTRGRCV